MRGPSSDCGSRGRGVEGPDGVSVRTDVVLRPTRGRCLGLIFSVGTSGEFVGGGGVWGTVEGPTEIRGERGLLRHRRLCRRRNRGPGQGM